MPFAFQIKNLNQALQGISNYSKEIQQKVDDELTGFAYRWVNDAQQLAPVDDGNLRANIRVDRNEFMNKLVVSAAPYSAYMEFGTGTNVTIPPIEDLQRFAAQFRGEGKQGTHPVKFKDGTWAMVPYQLNLRPRPFFFPSLQKNAVELPKRLKEILESK